jgi:hypothetical protein
MYLVSKHEGEEAAKRAADKLLGPGVPEDLAKQVDRLELWGTSFDDPGEDYCEWRLYSGDKLLATRYVPGY